MKDLGMVAYPRGFSIQCDPNGNKLESNLCYNIVMKRGKLRKQSKQKISVIQRKLWELCKLIIRLKYGSRCYTCSRMGLSGSNWHTGHMLPKASLGAFLKYDLRVLRPQCYNCNINQGGRGADFIENMRRLEGNEYVNSILEDRKLSVPAYDHYVNLVLIYSKLLVKLKKDGISV